MTDSTVVSSGILNEAFCQFYIKDLSINFHVFSNLKELKEPFYKKNQKIRNDQKVRENDLKKEQILMTYLAIW